MIDETLILSSDKIVCGVSGGADSIFLVHWLKKLEQKLNITVFACHLNHKTRGDESIRDLNFSKKFCKTNNIPFYFEEIDILTDKKSGFEASARAERYSFFNRALKHFGANKIATAHNLDDNLETVIFNLTRGSGMRGILGIPSARDNIIRPILNVSREEIENYLHKNCIEYIIDSSNLTTDYDRNKIRHKIVPILKEINGNVLKNVKRLNENLKNDNDFLEKVATDYYNKIVHTTNGEVFVLKNDIIALDKAICYRVLSKITKLHHKSLTFKHYNKIILMAGSKNPSFKINLYDTLEIFSEYDKIVFKNQKNEDESTSIKICENKILVTTNKFFNLYEEYLIDYNKVDLNSLYLEKRKTGDIIKINGCTKTVKKLFIEQKIPKEKRDFVPILRDKNGIIAICFIKGQKLAGKQNYKLIFRSKQNEK